MVQTNSAVSSYSSAQRAVSVTMGLASTLSLSTISAFANAPSQRSIWQAPLQNSFTGHSASGAAATWNAVAPVVNPDQAGAQAAVLPHSAALNSAYSMTHNPAGSFHAMAGAALAAAHDLNLASPAKQFIAGDLAGFRELTIQIGGNQQTLTMDSRLTAGEMVAAQQILMGGAQTIKLNATGTATGGTIMLNGAMLSALDSSVGGGIGSLTIAQGVRVVDSVGSLTLGGNLNNYGSLLTASTTRGASDHIMATTIFNALSGAIGSYTGGGGLYAADPVLTGLNGIANAGTISSAGNLTLNAPIIYNIATTENGVTSYGAISAARNVNINTEALNNAGVIAALNGNVNVSSSAATQINNSGGVIAATQGNINVSAPSGINLVGGDYYSKQLNLTASVGDVDTMIGEVSGLVNATGECVHVNADSSNLSLGNINATVDPYFTNTGSLTINASNTIATNGAPLTFVAGGSITSAKGSKGFDTSSKTGAGGDVTLIAGAKFTPNNPTPGTDPFTVTGSSGNVASIDLSGTGASTGAVTSIKTSGSGSGNSGNVTIIAYGIGAGTGDIYMSKTAIDTSTKGTGSYGDVTIIAGNPTPTNAVGIQIGKITGNNIFLTSATPDAGIGVTYDKTGQLSSGGWGPGTLQSGSISMAAGSTVTAKGNVTVETKGPVTLGAVSTPGNTIFVSTGSDLSVTKALNADTITLTANTKNISIGAAVGTTTTSTINVTGANITTTGSGVFVGKTANLTASGNIGDVGFTKTFAPIFKTVALKVQNVSANAGAHAILAASGDVMLTGGAAGTISNFYLKGSGNVSQAGSLNADNIEIISAKAMKLEGDLNGTGGTGGVAHYGFTAGTTFTQGDASGNGTITDDPVGFAQNSITAKGAINVLGAITNTQFLTITTPVAMTIGSATNSKAGINGDSNVTIKAGTFENFGSMSGFVNSITVTGATAGAITNHGTLGATLFNTLTTSNAKGGITIDAGTVGSDSFLTLATNNITGLGGDVHVGKTGDPGNLQIQSPGALKITAVDGLFSAEQYSGVSIQGPFNKAVDCTITGPGALRNPLSKLTNLSNFALSFEKGLINSPLSSISVTSDPVDGFGGVRIFAKNLIYNGPTVADTTFKISVDGSAVASATSRQDIQLFILGGDINVDGVANKLTSGTILNHFQLLATGKTNGNMLLSSSNIFRIDNAAANLVLTGTTTSPDSGNHILQIFGNNGVAINGNLSTQNTDMGYSDIQILTGSKIPFVIGSTIVNPAELVNGQIGIAAGEGIKGNLVTIINAAGLSVGSAGGPNVVLLGQNAIFTDASKITNNATITTPSFVQSATATITNNGLISTATTDLDIHPLTGSLTINNGANAKYSAPHAFTLSSSNGNVTITSTGGGSVAPLSESIDIQALKGTVTVGSGSDLTVLGASGNGGSITISAINLVTTGFVNLSAQTQNVGTIGGKIDINLSGTKTLAVGPNALNLNINNLGTNNGGEITLKNNGAITVELANLSMSNMVPASTDLTIDAKGLVYIGGNANVLTGYQLSNLTIKSQATSSFLLSGAKVNTNGIAAVDQGLAAESIVITNGGSIDTGISGLAIPQANQITLASAKGSLIFGADKTIFATVDPTTKDGGTINLSGVGLTYTGKLNINAVAGTAGDGGHVNLNLTGTKALLLNDSTGVKIDISNNSTQGGSVSVINGGAVTVDALTGLKLVNTTFVSGSGADLTLSAKGLLFVSNTQNIALIGLHNVNLTSNSKTTFLMQNAPAGGKGNGLSYNSPGGIFGADSVTVVNNGGSIDYGTDSINAHDIALTAVGGSLLFPASYTLIANSDAVTGDGGSITLSSKLIPYTNGLTLQAQGKLAGAGGAVSVTVTDTKAISLLAGGPAMQVDAGPTGTVGGSISFASGGALSVDPTAPIFQYGTTKSGGGLSLKANGILSVSSLAGLANVGLATLSLSSNSKTPFVLSGAAPSTNGVQGTLPGGYAAGDITFANIGGTVEGGTSKPSITPTKSLTLTTLTNIGSPTDHIHLTSTPSLIINTGAKGNAYIDLDAGTALSSANVGGSLNLTVGAGNFTLGGLTTGALVKAGSLNFTLQGTVDNVNTLTLGNIATTNGNLTVASNAQNLIIANNSTISSNNGNIYLQNLDLSKVNSPQITFKSGSVVHGVGPTANKNQGQVFISIGATPAINTLDRGARPIPGNPTLIGDGFFDGLMYFGTNAKFNGAITATDKTDILTSAKRILSFNTGLFASTAIFLEANVKITADPPMPAAPDATTVFYSNILNSANQQISAGGANHGGTNALINTNAVMSADANVITTQNISPIEASGIASVASTSALLGGISNNNVLSATSTFNTQPTTTAPQASSGPLQGRVSTGDNQYLARGANLLAPDTHTTINTPHGKVDIAAGAVVLMVSTDKGLAVYDLHDGRKGAVTVSHGNRSISLVPGRSVVLSDRNSTFAENNPAQFVGYRQVKSSEFGERQLHEAEFEIMSMVRGLKPLHQLMSSDNARTRRTMSNMLKTAAILWNLSQGSQKKDPYKLITSPQITAYAPSAH